MQHLYLTSCLYGPLRTLVSPTLQNGSKLQSVEQEEEKERKNLGLFYNSNFH
jgi:hypothetical protein